MSFTLHQVHPDDPQWEPIFLTMCEAFENPLQSMFRLFRPLPDPSAGPDIQAYLFHDFCDRMKHGLGAGSESIWQKVLDSKGNVVGGALWKIYHSNPFAQSSDDDETISWYPEGGQRDFVATAIQRLDLTRSQLATRAHILLNIIWIQPKWQRQGVGKIIMDWGVRKAEELGLEMWLDASPYGKGLYEQYGFTSVKSIDLSPPQEPTNREWKEIKEELGEMIEVVMWRPKDGPYVPGKSVKPWEEGN